MRDDTTKKTDQTDESERAADKIEQLPEQPISDGDAQAVKGGSIVYQSPVKVASIVYQNKVIGS